MQKSTVPLRERNRLETWALIHEAAYSLALAEGLGKTTVEAIADAAGVSKRTFFNYFATKEDAVMGIQAPTMSEDAIAAFRAGDGQDVFGRTVRLMVSVVRSMFPDESFTLRGKELVGRFPELRKRMFTHMSASEQLVEAVLLERYDDGANAAQAGLPAGKDSAMALLMLAGTVMRFAYTRDPASAVADKSAAVEEAIEIFREVIQATL